MNSELVHILNAYIADIYKEIQEIPTRVSHKTARAFDFNYRQTLDITFGPDVESYLYDDAQLVSAAIPSGHIGPSKVDKRFPIAQEFNKSFEDKAFPYVRNKQPIGFDGNQIEVRFDPCDPVEVIDAYHKIEDAYNQAADELGLRPEFGLSQHWHYTINQNDGPLFRHEEVLRPLPEVCIYSALHVQRAFPAFFTYPKRLEDESYAADFNVVKLQWHPSDKLSSVLLRGHEDYATIEPRLGVGPAEQSVALYLSSLKWALDYFIEQYEIMEEKALNQISLSGAGQDEIPVGHGAYMEVLEDTVENGALHDFLPKHIFNALVVSSAQGYIDYLERDSSPARSQSAIDNYIERCRDIIFDHS